MIKESTSVKKGDIQGSNLMPTCNDNGTTKRRTEENSTDYKSIQSYSVRGSALGKVENNLESFPEKARPLIRAVFDFVDGNCVQDNSMIYSEANKYFYNCDDDNYTRIGIYDATWSGLTLMLSMMSDQDKAVFDAILNKIHDKDESIRKAVLEPIAESIEVGLSIAKLRGKAIKDITVEPIIKDFFEQAFQINNKDEYSFYAQAKEFNGDDVYREYAEIRKKRQDAMDKSLKNRSFMSDFRDFVFYQVFPGSILLIIFISMIKLIEKM